MAEEIISTATDVETVETTTNETPERASDNTESTELARLKAELAKQKSALDKAMKEAGDAKKELRKKQTAEEIAQEEAREAAEARDRELNELRKKFAVAELSKKAMAFIGDEEVSNTVAEYLYGAEDADGAIDALNRAWVAREKALRLEFGKIPAPGVGSSDGETITKEQLDSMKYADRVKFATEHPIEYNKLMGR